MNSKCIHCGAELPEGASFCPHCEKPQLEKQEAKPPRLWRKKAMISAIVLVILAAIAFGIHTMVSPKTYEGGAEVVYRDGDRSYRALLSFSMLEERNRRTPVAVKEETIPAGMGYGTPSHLYVYDENSGDDVQEEFMSKVKSCTVEGIPLTGGEAVEIMRPEKMADFPYATRTATVIFNTSCGTNEIRWTLEMINGDTLILRQTLSVHEQPSIRISPENADLSSAAGLQAALDAIPETEMAEKIVNVYLPEVNYTEPVTLSGGSINLYAADPDHAPCFSGGVWAQRGEIHFFGITFAGSGSIGLRSTCPTMLFDCTVSGWDTGALAENDAWIGAMGCVFEGNGIGLHFDSEVCTFSNAEYDSDVFCGNDVAILLDTVPGDMTLHFPNTTFSGNGEDIRNPAQHPIDTSPAIFE